MMKRLLLIGFVFILLVPLLFAQPPSPTIFTGDAGIEIQAPSLPYLRINSAGELEFHIFNKSNGIPLTNAGDGVNCTAHLFDLNGSDMWEMYAEEHEDHWSLWFNESQVTRQGIYPFTIHCNSSTLGGYYTSYFEATEDGYEREEPLGIYIVLTVMTCLFVAAGMILYFWRGEEK